MQVNYLQKMLTTTCFYAVSRMFYVSKKYQLGHLKNDG